jgi:hypothetical protein
MNERINARTISTINLSRKLKLTQLMVDTGSFISRLCSKTGVAIVVA